MKYLSENDAENLLEEFGFNVIPRVVCSEKAQVPSCLSMIGLPVVMKVSGKKIVHKKKLGGVSLNVGNYAQALDELKKLKKIKGATGVMIQPKLDFDREFLVGVKRTPDFGHVLVFGSGGSRVEEKKDVSFRIFPVERSDILELMKEVKICNKLGKPEKDEIVKFILKMSDFVSKYDKISEMDVNPMVISKGRALVMDARILFD